jgi:site-specific DNA-methyltransferase (adenine-specific)
MFKYDWVWQKPKGTGHLNAKKQPMRDKEDVLVFYKKQCTYNPQMTEGKPYDGNARTGSKQQTSSYGKYKQDREVNTGFRYPKQVQKFGVVERGTLHPTEKPLEMVEYMIKTYTNEGYLILDNTCGSGTTGLGAKNLNRNYIMMEQDPKYYEIACKRVQG